jgi:hypothetical protein
VEFGGRTFLFSPILAGCTLQAVGEKLLAIVSSEEVIEFYANLSLLEVGAEPVREGWVLQPVGTGQDRLRLARRFVEARSIE